MAARGPLGYKGGAVQARALARRTGEQRSMLSAQQRVVAVLITGWRLPRLTCAMEQEQDEEKDDQRANGYGDPDGNHGTVLVGRESTSRQCWRGRCSGT